jgi:hypothetical protein
MDPTYKPSAYINIAGQQYAGGQFGIPLGSWTHLAATYDGTTLLFYVNGTQVGITIVSGNISAASGGLSIGGIGEEYFQGLIDEVRIYNRALSASEIQSDMNTPVTPVANPALPSPWLTANIGTVALTGAATESNGVYTVQGSGNLAGSADAFRFVYQPLSADGDITTRINSMTTNGVNRCVGVMVRESLAPNSKYAFMGIGQNLKFRWQRRSTTGGNTLSTTSVVATPPNAWARLVRSNSTLYGYSSTNGVNWTKLTSTSITMATNIYVGFVVASGSTNTLNTSVFSNVAVTP